MTKKQSAFWHYLVLATILAAGFGVVWGLGGAWIGNAYREARRSRVVTEYLAFRHDGTPVVQHYLGNRYETREYRDLDGNELDIGDDERWLYAVPLSARLRESSSEEVSWTQRLNSFVDPRRPPTYWYFICDGKPGGSAYLVGYDSLTNARVGFIGTQGFRENPLPPAEYFPFSGNTRGPDNEPWGAVLGRVRTLQGYYHAAHYPTYRIGPGPAGDIMPWQIYIQADGYRVYQVDLAQRSTRPVLEGAQVRSINLVTRPTKDRDQGINYLAARTDAEILMMNYRDQVRSRVPLPVELRERDFRLVETTAGEHLAYYVIDGDEFDPRTEFQIYWLDDAGHITRHVETFLAGNYLPYYTGTVLGVMLTMPAYADGVVAFCRPQELVASGRANGLSQAGSQALAELWPALLVGHMLGAALAILCYRRQMDYGAKGLERLFWPVFVFVLGLPGWVGYRYGRWWPVMERCPTCGAVVPQDRAICVRCQTEFPQPTPKGTEIFA